MSCAAGNLPFFSAPVVTFAVFTALPRNEFTISRAFTSLTLISLLEQSSVMFISSLPSIASALGCFDRLEAFLASIDSPNESSDNIDSKAQGNPALESQGEVEKIELSPTAPLFKTSNATFGAVGEGSFTIKNINLSILPRYFIGITGPSGCGKTLLVKALLKRLPCISGSCYISNVPMAYCSQTPWLCNGTIKDTIVGQTDFDEGWYKRVVHACALEHDLEAIHDGDKSVVGSQGSTLSGGQKQRLVSVWLAFNSLLLSTALL